MTTAKTCDSLNGPTGISRPRAAQSLPPAWAAACLVMGCRTGRNPSS